MSSTQQTLLLLIPGFPKDEADTTCLPAIQRFVLAMKNQYPQYQLIVFAFEYPFKTGEYDWHGVKVIAFGGEGRGKFYRLNNWRNIWKRLKQLNKEHHISGILSFWLGQCAFIGELFSEFYGAEHYCWLQGQDARAGNKYARFLRPDGDRLIAISDFLVDEYDRNYGVTIEHMIPLGLEPRTPTEQIERDIDVLGVGSLISLKQYDIFIDVIKQLTTVKPDIKAVICGKGPEEERLSNQINKLGLQNNVKLTGELPNDEVNAMLEHSKILLHPSSYEGFGMVITEALAAGCHVVSFTKPMKINLRHHYVVADKEEMQDKVQELLSDDSLEFASIIPYTISRTATAIYRLYRDSDSAME